MEKRKMMEERKIGVDIDFLIFLYLYLPLLIFFCGWIKWYLAAPAALLILLLMYKVSGNGTEGRYELFTRKGLLPLLGCAVFLLAWCVLSGQGAFICQSSDWGKHNVLLEDLVNYGWPVRYEFNGGGVMDYYIAGYLLPALFGKMLGGDTQR